jgi:hypothetical protein
MNDDVDPPKTLADRVGDVATSRDTVSQAMLVHFTCILASAAFAATPDP